MLQECGEKWRQRYILGFKGAPSVAMVAGTAFHQWSEAYEDNFLGIDPNREHVAIDLPQDYSYYLDRAIEEATSFDFPDPSIWKVSSQGKETWEWWREHGPEFCRLYKAWRETTGWELVSVEQTIEFMGSPFILDRIFRMTDGRLIIVDIKSGKSSFMFKPKPQQLYYYLSAAKSTGLDIDLVTFYDGRKGQNGDILRPKYWNEELLASQMKIAQAMIDQDLFLASVTSSCDWCPYRSTCKYYKHTTTNEVTKL